MRTRDEIQARIMDPAVVEGDFLGFARVDLLAVLDKPFTDDDIRATITDYLPFAFEKALNHRGLSAERSINHLSAWLWLLGDPAHDELVKDLCVCSSEHYAPYGAPLLRRCAEAVGFELPTEPEKLVRMLKGEPCEPKCSGCTGIEPEVWAYELLDDGKIKVTSIEPGFTLDDDDLDTNDVLMYRAACVLADDGTEDGVHTEQRLIDAEGNEILEGKLYGHDLSEETSRKYILANAVHWPRWYQWTEHSTKL